MGRSGHARGGFTLVEVLVALTIGSMVVLTAHQLFAAVAREEQILTHARAALDRSSNAQHWLTAAFLSLDVGTQGASGFEGRADHVAFAAWLLTPDGWFERRNVSLGRSSGRLLATAAPYQPLALMDSVQGLAFDYLLEPGLDARWVREWVSPVSVPLAIRVRVAKACNGQPVGCHVVDTLLFLIKERG